MPVALSKPPRRPRAREGGRLKGRHPSAEDPIGDGTRILERAGQDAKGSDRTGSSLLDEPPGVWATAQAEGVIPGGGKETLAFVLRVARIPDDVHDDDERPARI